MEIPIQQDVYIWANYSVSSYSNFIPIYWNVLIWLKYDFMHIFVHLSNVIVQIDIVWYLFETKNICKLNKGNFPQFVSSKVFCVI
jgi:hypothetical protein